MSVQLNTVPFTQASPSESADQIALVHDGREFSVIDSKNVQSQVPNYNLPKELRGISSEELKKAMEVGYLSLRKVGDEYAVRYNVRLAGGGPLFAAFAYIGTTVAGAALVGIGVVTTPIGIGAPIAAAGTLMIAAAPYTLAVTLTPTP